MGNQKAGGIISLLSLDVSGAFDNCSHLRLLHNLRKQRIGGVTNGWIRSFVKDRKTTLKVQGYAKEYKVETGIPQGSALSPGLYTIYNADLIELCNDPELGTMGIRWIDGGTVLVASQTAEDNCRILERLSG